jgi:TM2 domain-containing membrane protein YozV
MAARGGRRAHALGAAFLSSIFPGLGQLYNRHWVKAVAMIALAGGLLAAVMRALGAIATGIAATVPTIDLADPWTLQRQLVSVAGDPAFHANVRWRLLPPVLALCAVLLWSVVDAYVIARRTARAGSDTGPS